MILVPKERACSKLHDDYKNIYNFVVFITNNEGKKSVLESRANPVIISKNKMLKKKERLKSVRMHFPSKLESVRIGKCQNRKVSELESIHAGEDGRVSYILTKSGERIDCELVGLTAGVSPNIEFLKGGDLALQRGILINQHFETNQKDVYAIA